jgi:protein subunit release factor B
MRFNTELDVLKKETEVSYYKASGPGGQRKNKRETAVRLFHPASRITVIATERRSQAQNRTLAFKRLQKRLMALNRKEKPRIPTSVPQREKERRLIEKRKVSCKKRMRGRIDTRRVDVLTEDAKEKV